GTGPQAARPDGGRAEGRGYGGAPRRRLITIRTIRQCGGMLQNASDCLEVRVTASSREEADQICSAVVGQRLAADCQIIAPIESTYWWAGEIQRSEELLLLMKTTVKRFEDLARRVRELHSYEVPQIVAVALVAGTADYLEWIRRETFPGSGG
ncbi:divalent-cation tolerance protein CutA, partial [Streptosporangium canum]|uniref:divalent-cation tolerance protein CutA n=1 Tax=Streptosporangium canum TaxID=324952 RepID=UPI003439B300